MQVALVQLDEGNVKNYLVFSLILSLIFFVELATGWVFRASVSQKKAVQHHSLANRVEEFIHHLLIPLGLYAATVGFMAFNRQHHPRALYLIGFFFIITILFTNLRAFYEHRSKIEKQTHYIYDLAKLLLFFAASNVAFHVWNEPNQIVIAAAFAGVLALLLQIMTSVRYKKFEALLLILTLALSLGLTLTTLAVYTSTTPTVMQISAFATLEYYILTALLHHLINRDLTKEIILEYLVVFTISILLLTGLSN